MSLAEPQALTEGGRGHHRKAFFSILAGVGVKTNQIYGKTDDRADKIRGEPS